MSTYLQPMICPSFSLAQAQIYYVQKAQTIITMYLHTYSIIDIGQQEKCTLTDNLTLWLMF